MLIGVEAHAHLKSALSHFIEIAAVIWPGLIFWSFISENFSEAAQRRRDRR